MRDKNEEYIDTFFENNIITNKTLIIIDHISNIDCIFSKQELYGFFLIYVTKNIISTKGKNYCISEFDPQYIPDLQNNIKKNYTNIDTLNKNEIQVLYDLTSGNIGKIHFLLEHQEYVEWIKKINKKEPTSYDKELNTIQLELFIGHPSGDEPGKTKIADATASSSWNVNFNNGNVNTNNRQNANRVRPLAATGNIIYDILLSSIFEASEDCASQK